MSAHPSLPLLSAVRCLAPLAAAFSLLSLSSCESMADHALDVYTPASAGAKSQAEMLAGIDGALTHHGYRSSRAGGSLQVVVGQETLRFERVKRYKGGGGGSFASYTGPGGRVLFEAKFHFYPPFQFPSATFKDASREVREFTERKASGYQLDYGRFPQ